MEEIVKLAQWLLAGTVSLVLATGAARAADAVIIPPPAPAPPPTVPPAPTFVGPYWGVFGGYYAYATGAPFVGPMTGTQFGYNVGVGQHLRIGIEVETENYSPLHEIVEAMLTGRVGLVLGDNLLLYGQAGIGTTTPAAASWSLGGGIEIALNASLALFAEGKAFYLLGGGGYFGWAARAGVNYYPTTDNRTADGVFDWAGLYLGALGGVAVVPPNFGLAGTYRLAGAQVGYNFSSGPIVAGVEVETRYYIGGPSIMQGTLSGRLGFAFGNLLVYGEVGIGTSLLPAAWSAGGGVEIALGERIGLFAEGKALIPLAGPPIGRQFVGGINVHFGR